MRKWIICGYPCFVPTTKEYRRHERPISKVKRWMKNARYSYQRARYGFCERDIWEMDTWFLKTVPAMLEHLNRTRLSYPSVPEESYSEVRKTEGLSERDVNRLVSREWGKILSEMVYLFDEAARYEGKRITLLWERRQKKITE